MFSLYKLACLLFALLAVNAATGKSCRQCTGDYLLILNDYATEAQARSFIKTSLGGCVTGGEYELIHPGSNDCLRGACKVWFFNINAWRYCGNGPTVVLKKDNHGSGGMLALKDYLSLSCTESVVCHGNCNCAECGC